MFFPTSFFTAILPDVDQAPLYNQWNFDYPYLASEATYTNQKNPTLAKTSISTYLCPSNGNFSENGGNGYGQTDYMPVAYTNIIDPGATPPGTLNQSKGPIANQLWFADGFLSGGSRGVGKFRDCTDGMSNTIAVCEDAGRPANIQGKYAFTGSFTLQDACSGVIANGRCPNRWADGDTGNGVSGPPTGATSLVRVINNSNSPKNGPVDCPWATNNCGPNDEPFSYHVGGCQVLMGDGSVHFLSENIDQGVIRRLCDPKDGLTVTF